MKNQFSVVWKKSRIASTALTTVSDVSVLLSLSQLWFSKELPDIKRLVIEAGLQDVVGVERPDHLQSATLGSTV